MLQTVQELCALSGVSGQEQAVRQYIAERVAPYAADMQTDNMGNLLVFKSGAKRPAKRVLLAAHMDEVGAIVTYIQEDGYLKFQFVGGVDRRVVLGKRVYIGPNRVLGVIGIKAYHLVSDSEEKSVPKVEDLYIDIGAKNREEAEKRVSLGDVCVFSPEFVPMGGYVKAKALDDRVGCATMLQLIQQDLPVDCYFAFTVQEEAGLRGSTVAARQVEPEVALILEGTTAADLPTVKKEKQICAAGRGVVIPFMDGSTIYDQALYALLGNLADQADIPWQTKEYISGGTDAGAIQRSGAGVQTAGIAVAVRYIHSPASVASTADILAMPKLAYAFLKAMGDR